MGRRADKPSGRRGRLAGLGAEEMFFPSRPFQTEPMRLQQIVKDERHPHDFDPREYISTWTEKDLLHGKVVDAWVIIFRTRGCYWAQASGCSMCGYVNDVAREVSVADLRHQLDTVLKRHTGQPMVKVYTSGNFFDDHEVAPEVRGTILKELGDRCDKVTVETLSHLLRRDQLDAATKLVRGLEEHARAARVCRDAGATVKTYLLIKPPFLTEREAIEDAVKSGHEADPHSDTISFNPVNVQGHTLVDRLFRRREYRPPWLWSVVEVLERTRDLKAHVKSHPTAGGMRRGAHNCGTCDRRVIDAIEEFSLGLRTDFADLDCPCRET